MLNFKIKNDSTPPALLAFVWLLLLLNTASASAQAFDKIIVTVSPFASEIDTHAASASVISDEEKRGKQSLSLGDLIDEEAGISSISTGAHVGKPVIRGFTGNRIRILNNGISQDHQQYGVRHMPNVDPFLFQRVEVVRGPASVLYGADAMGGVINLVPNDIPDGSDQQLFTAGRLSGSYLSNNHGNMFGLKAKAA